MAKKAQNSLSFCVCDSKGGIRMNTEFTKQHCIKLHLEIFILTEIVSSAGLYNSCRHHARVLWEFFLACCSLLVVWMVVRRLLMDSKSKVIKIDARACVCVCTCMWTAEGTVLLSPYTLLQSSPSHSCTSLKP